VGKIKLSEIIGATGGRLLSKGIEEFTSVSTDSRTIREGEVFFALKGERFDGNDFVLDALKRASGAVVSRVSSVPTDKTIILVEDTLRALQGIAHQRRLHKDIPIIGITGSNGKTTTKEMTASILASNNMNVLKNQGNLNNQIGLPLTLIGLNSIHDIAVLEMGASRVGDIKELCDIALPTHAIITNIGHAHIEGFGSRDAIRAEKLSISYYAKTIAINADDEYLLEGIKNIDGVRLIRYGIKSPDSEVRAEDIEQRDGKIDFKLRYRGSSIRVSLPLSGIFNIYNALSASAMGLSLGVSLENIKNGLEGFCPVGMRFNIRTIGGITIIEDVYNSNPDSLEASLIELKRLSKGRMVAVLGDMLELGSYAETAHRHIARLMNELGVGLFIAVGPLMALGAEDFRGKKFIAKDSAEAGRILKIEKRDGDTILVKGSRGMKMEEAIRDAL